MLPKTWKFPHLMKDSKFETYMPSFFKELVSMYEAIVKELSPLDEELLTWDPGSIADGDSLLSDDISVPEAELGDYVLVSASCDLRGLGCVGYIKSSGVAKINLLNLTGGAVNLAKSTWRILVYKANRV